MSQEMRHVNRPQLLREPGVVLPRDAQQVTKRARPTACIGFNFLELTGRPVQHQRNLLGGNVVLSTAFGAGTQQINGFCLSLDLS